MNLDTKKVFHNQLALSFGLPTYRLLINQLRCADVSADKEFQKKYNYFYRIRRNEAWRNLYFNYLERQKNSSPSFEEILRYLYEQTGQIEPSFSSKLLATIHPDKPIWDQQVLGKLGLKLADSIDKKKKLNDAVALYDAIETRYKEILDSAEGKKALKLFDTYLPDYRDLTNVKKIDCILWAGYNVE